MTACVALPNAAVVAQVAKTTWAVRVTDDSRCARAPGFRDKLAAQIPPEQNASETEAVLVAELRVVRATDGLTATVTVIDRVLGEAAGEREIGLPASDCEATAEALALVIGVLVEAGRGAPVAEPVEPEPEPPPPPPPPPEPKPKPKPKPVKRYSWLGPRPGHDLSLGPVLGFGLLPGLAVGAAFEWGLRLPQLWPVVLGATAYLPSDAAADRARFRANYGRVATCPLHAERGRLRGRACPSFAAGLLKASGRGFLEGRNITQPIVLLGAELAGDVRVAGPITLGLVARVEAPLLRQRFFYYAQDGSNPPLHQAKPVAITSFVTVGLRFR